MLYCAIASTMQENCGYHKSQRQ